jgi:hypothetical protein
VTFIEGSDPALLAPHVRLPCAVLLNDVLEHVPDDFRLFSELLAILPPGAFLVITVPAEEALWSPHDVGLSHYRRYEVARLRRVWEGLPVRELVLSGLNARLYPLARLRRARTASKRPPDQGTLSDFWVPPGPFNRILGAVFASERVRIVRALRQGQGPIFRRGVSLLAVLERSPGAVAPRVRPEDEAPDSHQPGVR